MGVSHDLDVALVGTDPDLFEVFYREHVEAVQRFVARRVNDPHVAADLTADIFLAVIEAAASYRPEAGPPRAWLFGVARNVTSTELRRRRRHTQAVGRLQGRRQLEPDAIERAVERIDAAREARALVARLDVLTPAARAVFELVVVDGLGVVETAQVLGLTQGTVRVRLHRARQQLGAALSGPRTSPLPTEAPS
jgi:RNA polymerase sigma factor (sigma-70 family)